MVERLENSGLIASRWQDSAEQDYVAMQNLLKSRDYNWALFLGHLVLEKLLKALYVKMFQKHAIYSHDLLRLAKSIEIEISEDYEEWLDEITTFNLNARYDIQKQDFRKRCTKEFAEEWSNKIKTVKEWLTSQL